MILNSKKNQLNQLKAIKNNNMIEYRYNAEIDFLEIDPMFLQNGISYAENNQYDSIRITTLNGYYNEKYILDLSPFEDKTFIKKIIIGDDFKITKILGLSYIEKLTELRYFQIMPAINIDVHKLTSIETFLIKNDRKISGLNELINVKKMLISSTQYENLYHINKLKQLENLHLSGNKILKLSGIENLQNIQDLKLTYCSALSDIQAITYLPKLSRLYIEKCKNIHDLSFLNENQTIQEIFIDDISSLDFIPSLTKLKQFSFWNCKNGNLKPLLQSESLTNVNFFPNKRYYSHTLDNILKSINMKKNNF